MGTLGAETTAKSHFSKFTKQCLAELLGTYLLVFFGPTSVILTASSSLTKPESLTLIAATFAIVVAAMILILGEHSGAVINPAISLGAFLSGDLKKGMVVPYLLFQSLGGIAAGLTLKLLFSTHGTTNLGATKLSTGIGPLEGIIIEAVGTFVLAASALTAGRKLKRDLYKGLLVGATLFVLIILIGPLTGASFNPARTLGPAIASPYLDNLYVYLIGTFAGGIAAGILFRVAGKRIERKDTIRLRA
jgi:aquaporin Z